MSKRTGFFLLVIVLFVLPQTGLPQTGDFSLKGCLKNATGWRISEDKTSDILKCENIVELEPHFLLGQHLELHGVFRYYYDAVFDLEDDGWTEGFRFRREIRESNDYTVSDPVRELYADCRWKRFFVRLGKQQVAWGEAIGVKMLDVINPQDFREVNQLDFEDSRISLWSANIKYSPPLRGSYLQFIIIPDVRPDYLPPAGYPFSSQPVVLFQRFIDEGKLHLDRSATRGKRISRKFKNLEVGVKWYQNLGWIEYGFNYFYHFSDVPGLYPGDPVFNPDSSLNYVLEYHRLHTLGGSFTKVFESFFGLEGVVLRGELAIKLNDRIIDAYTALFSDPRNPFGVEMAKTDTFNYLLALEKFFLTDYYVSFQFFQFILLDHKGSYLDFLTIRDIDYNRNAIVASSKDKVDNVFTFYLSTGYFQDRVLPDLLGVYFDDGAFWFRGRCGYKYSDHWRFTLGMNLYFGGNDTGIGQYHDVDNLFTEVKFEF